jgi:hypothetical protein
LKVDEVANLLNGDFGYRRLIYPERVMRIDDDMIRITSPEAIMNGEV